MTFIFDLAPLVTFAVIIGGCVVTFIGCVLYAIIEQYIFIPLKHWKTGLKLYRFEKQVYNTRRIDKVWLKNDDEAITYQCRYDMHGSYTAEIYPNQRSIKAHWIN